MTINNIYNNYNLKFNEQIFKNKFKFTWRIKFRASRFCTSSYFKIVVYIYIYKFIYLIHFKIKYLLLAPGT